jgi:hypothetical protein
MVAAVSQYRPDNGAVDADKIAVQALTDYRSREADFPVLIRPATKADYFRIDDNPGVDQILQLYKPEWGKSGQPGWSVRRSR